MASKKLNGTRRQLTPEFKAGAARLVLQEGRTVAEVARDLDLWESVLHQWVKQAKVDGGKGPAGALSRTEKDELATLRRENRLLKQERDILKKAAAFFAKENA
jgi:transposase